MWWEHHLRIKPAAALDYASLDLSTDTPRLAGIDQMSERVGATAVDMVIAQLHRNDTGVPPYQKMLHPECVWREGPSVRRAPT